MIDGGKAVLVLVICIVMMTKIAGNRSDRKGDPLSHNDLSVVIISMVISPIQWVLLLNSV